MLSNGCHDVGLVVSITGPTLGQGGTTGNSSKSGWSGSNPVMACLQVYVPELSEDVGLTCCKRRETLAARYTNVFCLLLPRGRF